MSSSLNHIIILLLNLYEKIIKQLCSVTEYLEPIDIISCTLEDEDWTVTTCESENPFFSFEGDFCSSEIATEFWTGEPVMNILYLLYKYIVINVMNRIITWTII